MRTASSAYRISAPLVAAVVLVLALSLVHFTVGGGWREAWHGVGSSSMSPAFADLRTITHSLDAVRAGFNPYVDTRFDPWGRTFNYPRAWLWLAPLGIGARSTMAIGATMAVLLFAALSLLFRTRRPITWLAAFGFSLAPPVLLGVERGNGDILIFSLLVFGIAISKGLGVQARPLVRGALVAALTVLKIFPIAAIAMLIRDRRGLAFAVIAASVALACLWLSLHPGDMAHILGNTPQSVFNAFGALPLVQAAATTDMPAGVPVRSLATVLALVVAIASAIIALVRPAAIQRLLPPLESGRIADDVALACLGIHLLAFMSGSSWDYRLIFLIGTVPPMLAAYDRQPRRMLLVVPVLVGVFLWAGPLSPYIHASEEVLDWAIFALVASWLTATIAPRIGLAQRVAEVIRLPASIRHDSGGD